MIVFPAVDIKNGQCVRLKQGKADEVTVFGSDPVQMAENWVREGARWLHLVDLDGAFKGVPANYELIRTICSRIPVPVQLGGGIRDAETAANYFQAGVKRLIVGTLAMKDPEGLRQLCRRFPGRIGVSLDAENGRLKSKGWVEDSGLTVFELLPRLQELGASFLVYTDISRDGMQTGVDREKVGALLEGSDLPLILAGGIDTLEQIKELADMEIKGLEGVITGRAIYTGSLNFREAVRWVQEREQQG